MIDSRSKLRGIKPSFLLMTFVVPVGLLIILGVAGYSPYCSSKAGIEYQYQIGKGIDQTPKVIKKPYLIFFKCK